MRRALAGVATLVSLVILAAGCGGHSGVEKYVAAKWPTFPSNQDSLAVAWPDGKFKSCEKSSRVVGNFACYYEDDSGQRGFICVTTNFDDSDSYSINVAVGPTDQRKWYDDAGNVMTPKQLC